MPISNAYIPEAALAIEISKNGVIGSDSSHSLDSKSSESSGKLHSDSTPASRLDSIHDSHHLIFPHVKEKKLFQIQRSSIPNNQKAYYSDFYDSNGHLPAAKKCMNFYRRHASSNCSSESDIFKRLAFRRFSLNPEVLRKAETSKCLQINRFSLDDMDSYHTFHQCFSDWNEYFGNPAYTQKSVGFEENMSSGHFYNSSDSLSSSSTDSDYERSLKKSIRDYFKSRMDRDSTSSLCTSQSSSYAVGSFPEETLETLDDSDEAEFLNSPILGNDRLPLHPSLLNLRSTEAEQMLFNLGFCDPSGIIPARFFPNWTKQENGEASRKASKREMQANLPENNQLQNYKEAAEDIISKNKKGTDVDSHVVHLLMNKKNVTGSCDKASHVDFEEINQSTVHVLNNNKPVFYKQKSIHDEIEEANRNTSSVTFQNIPEKESSLTNNAEPNKNDCDQDPAEQKYCESRFEKNITLEKGETDQSLEESPVQNSNDNQIDTENASYSRIPNMVVSNQISISNISEKSRESFEIPSIFGDSELQSADFRTETKKENGSNEEVCIKSTYNSFFDSCSFLSVSCASSPAESPLTVIDMSLHDNKDRTSTSSEEYIQKRINNSQSFIDLDSDDQFDEVFAYNSNFHCIQEDSSNNSGVEEHYSQDDENCCWDSIQLNPYLTYGPDVVTIYKNSSKVENEDHSDKKLSPPRFYTSSFDMFIKSPQKESGGHQYQSSDERKKSHSKTFSPLVIDGIMFDGSEQNQNNLSVRGSGNGVKGEDTSESKVFHAAACFSSGSKIGRTFHCSEKSGKKMEVYCNLNDPPIENEDKNCPEHISRENKNDRSEIKVSKANIIFKLESKNHLHNKISSKVIMKNIDHSQRRWQRQSSDPMSDNHKRTRDSSTQCNFEDYLRKRNLYDDDNIDIPLQKLNLSKKSLLKNSYHSAADLHMESKERKILLNKKENLTSAIIEKNGSINADSPYFMKDAAALDFNPTSQLPNNSNTGEAVLCLHKGSQTRIWGLHPLCKNELNICAKCLSHMNWPCLQPHEK